MAKLCAKGKAAAKRKFKYIPQHMLTCMVQQYVQVKYTRWQEEKKKSYGWWNDERRMGYKNAGSV